MFNKGWDKLISPLLGVVVALVVMAEAQPPNAFRDISEPGVYGARIHPGALAPTLRKWYLPQQLYYEYRWRGWEYSNYAREHYQRYVSILLEGTRQYDPLGNYISRGWRIYDWTEHNPQSFGSTIFKSPRYRDFFSNVIVSSASKGEFYTALTVGDAIRTTLTPLTFSKPSFNGMQWDFLSDKYALTLLASRVNAPAGISPTQQDLGTATQNSTRVLGGRALAQVGDFAKVGVTWVNAHHSDSEFNLGENSLKGVLTRDQNLDNVEEIKLRISDDSPESPESGAVLFLQRIKIDGVVQENMQPLVEGGVREEGVLNARGSDVMTLTYDVRNGFTPTLDTPGFQDIQSIEFELIMANDYKVEVGSNKSPNRLDQIHFLPVFQAEGNVADGSNQRFLRFKYGLPTANEVLGVDLNITNVGGLDLSTEYVVNRRYQRFPNQTFQRVRAIPVLDADGVQLTADDGTPLTRDEFVKLPASKETAEAFFLTGSYTTYPFFTYGETFYLDPDYTTSAFMGDRNGEIDYDERTQHIFEFVDDNDDQDLNPDWQRSSQGVTLLLSEELGSGSGGDQNVFPGLDENNDFVSDFNQNANQRPDYAEAFLRYAVDAPEFLFGMDMNNNTIIDRFEDDVAADLPYEVDRSGYNIYGGLALSEGVNASLGRTQVREISSGRKNRTTYALLTAEWDIPDWELQIFEQARWAKDDISEDRLVWRDPVGIQAFEDPLDAQDTFINTIYSKVKYTGVPKLNVLSKVKFEKYFQRNEQEDLKRDRSFFGLINKADYEFRLTESVTLWPKIKSTYQRTLPSTIQTAKEVALTKSREETLFLVTRYSFLPQTWVDLGLEFSNFNNLKDIENLQLGEDQDFKSTVLAVVVSNTSAYIGYRLTMNAGFQREKRTFDDASGLPDDTETTAFVRMYAATGEL